MNQDLINICRKSAFNKSSTGSTISFRTMFKSGSLQLYTDYDQKCGDSPIAYATPEFQRANNKWTDKQKTKLIENLMKGYRTTVMLFRMAQHEDAKIIDGLQRLTAMYDFHNDSVKAFGLKKSEIDEVTLRRIGGSLEVKVYTFDDWESVGRFYIEMNEEITHSAEDIQKCKDWFLTEKNIQL